MKYAIFTISGTLIASGFETEEQANTFLKILEPIEPKDFYIKEYPTN